MQIDWFTLFAQIVNFLIVVVLLRRFLYKPILQAMAEREAKIAAQFEGSGGQNHARPKRKPKRYRAQRAELDEEIGAHYEATPRLPSDVRRWSPRREEVESMAGPLVRRH